MIPDSDYLPCESCPIRTHVLFRHLSDEEIRELSLNKITESYKRGSIIYSEGNRMSALPDKAGRPFEFVFNITTSNAGLEEAHAGFEVV